MYIETTSGHIIESNNMNVAGYIMDYYGIIDGMLNNATITFSGLSITLSSGLIMMFGKAICLDGGTITLSPSTQTSYDLCIDVDMGAKTVTFVNKVNGTDTYYTDDLFINPTTGKHTMKLATVTANQTQIISLQMVDGIYLVPSSVNYDLIYPVGYVMLNSGASYNPNDNIPDTTWARITAGYNLVTGGPANDTAGAYVGDSLSLTSPTRTCANTVLTTAHIPKHNHSWNHSHTINAHTHTWSHAHSMQTNIGSSGTFKTASMNNTGNGSGTSRMFLNSGGSSVGKSSLNTGSGGSGNTDNQNLTIGNNSGNITTGNAGGNSGHNHTIDIPMYLVSGWVRTA